LRIAAVWLLAILCYSNCFSAGLVYDDVALIKNDARVRAVTGPNLDLIFSEDYNRSGENLYRPLTTLSYLFNYAILGGHDNPAGYHVFNLAIHLLNIALVYCLGLLLFSEWTLAVALAALWGVHPALTEAVTNIVGRADMMAAFGVLAGVLCHAYGQMERGNRKIAWLAGLALSAAIAIFSKEAGVVLPAVMLLLDLTHPNRPWRERWPGYATVAAPFAVFFALRAQLMATHPVSKVPFTDNPVRYLDFLPAKLTALKYLGVYLRIFFWPVTLSADYSYNQIPSATLSDWRALLSAVILVALLAAGVLAYRRAKPLFFFVLLFFIAIAPVANFFLPVGTTVAERLLYLPAVGLMGCVVLLISRFLKGRALLAGAALICCLFGVRTFARNFVWYTEESLWTDTMQSSPNASRGYSQYAVTQMNRDPAHLDKAVEAAEKSIRIIGDLPPQFGSSRFYMSAGDTFMLKAAQGGPDAQRWYQRAYDTLTAGARVLEVEAADIRFANLERGQRAGAVVSTINLTIARAALHLGRPQDAVNALLSQRSLRPHPDFAPLLAEAYRAEGNANAAEVSLIEGLVLDANATRLASPLMELYKEKNPQSCAVKGNNIDMTCPLVHEQLCTASRNIAQWYAQGAQIAKAQATEEAAVQQMGCPAR